MFEPLFTANSFAALEIHDSAQTARDAALVLRATNLAIESAFTYGVDFPCGAVTARGDTIIGRGIASDTRHGFSQMHAEFMAVMDAKLSNFGMQPDTLAVSLEPCVSCQDFLATQTSITRVVFPLVRKDASDRGLVNPKDQTIFERAAAVGLPYELVHLEDTQLRQAGGVILDNVVRDRQTGVVRVNRPGLQAGLIALRP